MARCEVSDRDHERAEATPSVAPDDQARVGDVSTEGLAEFQERYAALVVAACEWRAMQANPEVLADRVFAILRDAREAPDLHRAYNAIRSVVLDSYLEYSNRRSILDRLRGVPDTVANAPQDTKQESLLRGAITRLSDRDRELLQMAYWDELAESELCAVLRTDPAALRERLTRARAKYVAFARRAHGTVEPESVSAVFRSLKPGLRSRWE